MPKNFEIEIREIYEKQYLKIFLKVGEDHQMVANCLNGLHSVKTANVSDQRNGKRDLTIYPEKAYDIREVEQEVRLALSNYFTGNPIDPVFVTTTLSAISDIAYFQILDYILLLGKNLEGFKALNVRFDEERYRDYFIPFLNSISNRHSAKGEVFNRQGKTDILLFDNEGNNVFIAECKLWKGEVYFKDALDQLLNNYVNWRDEKVSVIIFNRDVKKFTDVIETAVKATTNHKHCKQYLGQRKETSFSFIFKHPDDENRVIRLEVILFNFA